MSEFEKKKIEKEFAAFAKRNFESPKKCRNIGQVRYYVQELCLHIDEFKKRFDYVPKRAYRMLSEYNYLQNHMVHAQRA